MVANTVFIHILITSKDQVSWYINVLVSNDSIPHVLKYVAINFSC